MTLEKYRVDPKLTNWADRLANAATAFAVILTLVPLLWTGHLTEAALGAIAAAFVGMRACAITQCRYADHYWQWVEAKSATHRDFLELINRCHAEEMQEAREKIAGLEAELAKFKRGMKCRDAKTGRFLPAVEVIDA